MTETKMQGKDSKRDWIEKYDSVRHHLNVEKRVVFVEAGNAFQTAAAHIEDPDTQDFLSECMQGVVDIFLVQCGGQINQLYPHFNHVLSTTEYAIRWDLETNFSIKFVPLLERLFDADRAYYVDMNQTMGYYGQDLRKSKRMNGPVSRIDLIDSFNRNGGFDILLKMLRREIPCVEVEEDEEELEEEEEIVEPVNERSREQVHYSLSTLKILLFPFIRAKDIIPKQAVAACEIVMDQIQQFSSKQIENECTDNVSDIYEFVAYVLGKRDDRIVEFVLELSAKAMHTKMFPLRKLGLELICKVSREIHQDSIPYASSQSYYANHENAEPDIPGRSKGTLDEDGFTKWVSENKIVESLFESKKSVHHVLINRSKGLLEYMLQADCLSNSNIDMIFKSSIGNHESIQGAVHSLLAELALDINASVAAACYILDSAKTFVETNCEEILFFVRKHKELFYKRKQMTTGQLVNGSRQYVHAHPQVLQALLQLLWAILFVPTGIADNERKALMSYIIDLLRLGDASTLRKTYILESFDVIQRAKTHNDCSFVYEAQINSAYELLPPMINLFPMTVHRDQDFMPQSFENVEESTSQRKVIELLHKRFDVLNIVVEETNALNVRFLSTKINTSKGISQTEVQRIQLSSVKCRLDFLRHLLQGSSLELSFGHIEALWESLHDSAGGELFLVWLRQMAIVPKDSYSTLEIASLSSIFTDLLCKRMEFSKLTIQGFRCVATFFVQVNQLEEKLTGMVQQQPQGMNEGQVIIFSVQSADIVGIDTMWEIFLASPKETAMETMKLLLEVQIKLESRKVGIHAVQALENGEELAVRCFEFRKTFLDKIFATMTNETSKSTTLHRCVQLLAVYLEYFSLPKGAKPHAPMVGEDIELLIQHDMVLVHSAQDIGKQLEKRFKTSGRDTGYEWYPGLFLDYDGKLDTHKIWYADGETKDYNMHKLTRVGASTTNGSEMLYKMLQLGKRNMAGSATSGITSRGPPPSVSMSRGIELKLDSDAPEHVKKVYNVYKPLKITVKESAPLSYVRSLILERLETSSDSCPISVKNMTLNMYSGAVSHHQSSFFGNQNSSAISRVLDGRATTNRIGFLEGEHTQIGSFILERKDVTTLYLDYDVTKPARYCLDNVEVPAGMIAGESTNYSSVLMGLLDSDLASHATKRKLWELLMVLPTDHRLFQLLRDGSTTLNWKKELQLDSEHDSVLRPIYLLQIVDRFMAISEKLASLPNPDVGNPPETPPSESMSTEQHSAQNVRASRNVANQDLLDWPETFLASGGFVQVCTLLERVLRITTNAMNTFTPPSSPVNLQIDTSILDPADEDKFQFVLWQRGTALPVLLRLIKTSTITCLKANSSLVVSDDQWESLVRNLRVLITSVSPEVCKMRNGYVDDSTSDGLDDAIQDGLDNPEGLYSVFACALEIASMILSKYPRLVVAFLGNGTPQEGSLLDVLLLSPFENFREQLRDLLTEIANETNESFHNVENQAISTLERIPKDCSTCEDFFMFLSSLMEEKAGLNSMEVIRCAKTAAQCVINYSELDGELGNATPKSNASTAQHRGRRKEKSPSHNNSFYKRSSNASLHHFGPSQWEEPSVDSTLLGYLQLLLDVVRNHGEIIGQDRDLCHSLLNSIFYRYLIAVPTPDDKKRVSLAVLPQTRQLCFELLDAISKSHLDNLLWIVDQLRIFFESTPIPTNRSGKMEWSYKSDEMRKMASGFVGLINQGATCYQNSVLQQLFMTKPVRNIILNCAAPSPLVKPPPPQQVGKKKIKPRTKENLVRTLQRTMQYLRESDKMYFNPRPFVNQSQVLNLSDGHLSQNDAIEFYSRLIDSIEDSLTGQPGAKQLEDLLYVKTCTMNVRKCKGQHRTESEVGTPFLTLNVRSGMAGATLHTLEDALDSTFKTEQLTGLQCDMCNMEDTESRYDADQIKYLSALPKVLIMQLQRFDFDYEQMQPTKLNHRVSFEQRIDLKRFTKKHVLATMLGEVEEDIQSDKSGEDGVDENSDTLYDLKGVVVHQGSGANFGHYYSFIKDRDTGKWYRFDDERVTPFDESQLEEECFGGPYQTNFSPQGGPANHHNKYASKSNNAYLLLYEQVNPPEDNAVEQMQQELQKLHLGTRPTNKNQSPWRFAYVMSRLLVLKRRAVARIEARARARKVQSEVWEDNMKNLRHGIAFAPDLLRFCLGFLKFSNANPAALALNTIDECVLNRYKLDSNALEKIISYGITVFQKIVLHAESQKGKLRDWVIALKELFERSVASIDETGKNMIKWFLIQLTSNDSCVDEWFKPLLISCPDRLSRTAFVQLLMPLIDMYDKEASDTEAEKEDLFRTMANTAIRSMPFGLCNCIQLYPFMEFWLVLSKRRGMNNSFSKYLLEENVVALLLQFVVDNGTGNKAIPTETEQKRAMGQYAEPIPNTNQLASINAKANFSPVIRAVTNILLPDLISILQSNTFDIPGTAAGTHAKDTMFGLNSRLHSNTDLLNSVAQLLQNGLPQLPESTVEVLYKEETIDLLASVHPGPACFILAIVVRGETKPSNLVFDKLFSVMSPQVPMSVLAHNRALNNAVEALTCVCLVKDSFSNRRAEVFVEKTVRQCVNLKRTTEDARKHMSQLRHQANNMQYIEKERQEQFTRAINVILHVAQMYTSLFFVDKFVRNHLRQHVKHWSWMPKWLDQMSYEKSTGGMLEVSTRSIPTGRVVRQLKRMLVSVAGENAPLVNIKKSFVEVTGAGLEEINGTYTFDGYFRKNASEQVDSFTPKFVRVVGDKRYNLYKCKIQNANFDWYISNVSAKPGTKSDIDYYFVHQGEKPTRLPPEKGWQCCKYGQDPSPASVLFCTDDINPEEDMLEQMEEPEKYAGIDASILIQPQSFSSSYTSSTSDDDSINSD